MSRYRTRNRLLANGWCRCPVCSLDRLTERHSTEYYPVGSAVLPIQRVLGIIFGAACTLYQQSEWEFQMMTSDLLSMVTVVPSIQFRSMLFVVSRLGGQSIERVTWYRRRSLYVRTIDSLLGSCTPCWAATPQNVPI